MINSLSEKNNTKIVMDKKGSKERGDKFNYLD